MNRITVLCFMASYVLALLLELLQLWLGRFYLRVLALIAGFAGLIAQTLYLYSRRPPLVWQFGWMLFMAWILAIFYLCGAVQHRRFSWGVFVLPLLLGLLALGLALGTPPPEARGLVQAELVSTDRFWIALHIGLILLATVSVCIAFLASVMYLFQSHRLRTKTPPGEGLRLLSLERLEDMNRQAIILAFPLLTAGILAGMALMLQGNQAVSWMDLRVLSTNSLWLVFALLLYLRYGYHLRGRQIAFLTIVAFVVLLCCLALTHPLPHPDRPQQEGRQGEANCPTSASIGRDERT